MLRARRCCLPLFFRRKTAVFCFFLISFCFAPPCAGKTAAAGEPVRTTTPSPMEYEKIIITEKDITDRAYDVIGAIEIRVSKFENDYKGKAVEKLKKYACCMGADAVINLVFVTDGDFSTLEYVLARGTAVKFR
jgi:uncharacterized protein YbjQ (UPF0145 family)